MIVYRNDLFITGWKPEMVPVQIALLDIAHTEQDSQPHYIDITISGAMEGDHSQTSRHWSGMALDCFCIPWNESRAEWLGAELRKRLPDRLYDVIVEGSHVHVEFDPKIDKVTVE